MICATGITQWSTRPMVETDRNLHFWVCRLMVETNRIPHFQAYRSGIIPLNLSHVEFSEKTIITSLIFSIISFFTSAQYKVWFVKGEEPACEADHITRLESFTVILKLCTCMWNQHTAHQSLPNLSWCLFFQNYKCHTEIGRERML